MLARMIEHSVVDGAISVYTLATFMESRADELDAAEYTDTQCSECVGLISPGLQCPHYIERSDR